MVSGWSIPIRHPCVRLSVPPLCVNPCQMQASQPFMPPSCSCTHVKKSNKKTPRRTSELLTEHRIKSVPLYLLWHQELHLNRIHLSNETSGKGPSLFRIRLIRCPISEVLSLIACGWEGSTRLDNPTTVCEFQLIDFHGGKFCTLLLARGAVCMFCTDTASYGRIMECSHTSHAHNAQQCVWGNSTCAEMPSLLPMFLCAVTYTTSTTTSSTDATTTTSTTTSRPERDYSFVSADA